MAIVEDVQARLDSYKTNKQRRRRFKELENLRRTTDSSNLEELTEWAVLRMLLEYRLKVTAAQIYADIWRDLASGKLPAHIDMDGEDITIPPEALRPPH